MNKRKNVSFEEGLVEENRKKPKETVVVKKHSLDSDEEDDEETTNVYNVLDVDDIEGEEDGVAGNEDGIRTTAFNMKEELEEGHFDKDGHFLWNKDQEIKDNWLDNIDWQGIKTLPAKDKKASKTLADDSDSDNEDESFKKPFNEIQCYKEILTYMEPKETINKTLQRLGGGNKKLSSVERLKLKKAGLLNANNEKVTKLTELSNEILCQLGNMDVYQETFEKIKKKISDSETKHAPKSKDVELDMYADDFVDQEKKKLDEPETSSKSAELAEPSEGPAQLMWEYKLKQDDEKIEGPHSTEQMQKFVDDGKFKTSVWVRKTG